MNLPNKITCFRVVLIPIFLFFLLTDLVPGSNYIAAVIFVIASLSDLLDGYLARKNNLVTNFGKFMDPLADKLLVCSALICFSSMGRAPVVAILIIIAREFIISGFRLVAADAGVVIAAGYLGKIKTTAQMVSCVLLIIHLDNPIYAVFEKAFLLLAVFFTVISLVDYIWRNRQVLVEESR